MLSVGGKFRKSFAQVSFQSVIGLVV